MDIMDWSLNPKNSKVRASDCSHSFTQSPLHIIFLLPGRPCAWNWGCRVNKQTRYPLCPHTSISAGSPVSQQFTDAVLFLRLRGENTGILFKAIQIIIKDRHFWNPSKIWGGRKRDKKYIHGLYHTLKEKKIKKASRKKQNPKIRWQNQDQMQNVTILLCKIDCYII